MKIRKLIYFLPVYLIFLSGCSISRSFVTFETLQPAEYTFPKDVKRIGYMNRSPFNTGNFALQSTWLPLNHPFFGSTLQDKLQTDSVLKSRFPSYITDTSTSNLLKLSNLDSIVNKNLIKGFNDALSTGSVTQSYFDSISYIDARYTRISRFQNLPMDTILEVDIMRKSDLDALVSQDQYKIGIGHYHAYPLSSSNREFVINSSIKWSVYLRGHINPVYELEYKQKAYYPYDHKNPESLTFEEILTDCMENIGFKYGSIFVPSWEPETRILFGGLNPKLVQAKKRTNDNNWEEALLLWNELLKKHHHRVEAKAYHNLAVYYEMIDDIDQALIYLKQAEILWNNQHTEYYLKELNARKINQAKILIQVR